MFEEKVFATMALFYKDTRADYTCSTPTCDHSDNSLISRAMGK